ncbi:Uncharacterized protein conserved in bacteria [Moraxella lacunata]|uniref:Uncharacterized protein conserved in bacteria n=1 Tax=Moraxella lacunata TaxID=477 RepID=A0A378UEF9_MORLA|nr:hypothetical protein [Moraxella lacunata]STZ74841.1 Uncharacterized protein conserved in bacteria [Moraxella lacunata]
MLEVIQTTKQEHPFVKTIENTGIDFNGGKVVQAKSEKIINEQVMPVVQTGVGLAEVGTGAAMCASGVGCGVGSALIIHGSDNVATGATNRGKTSNQQTSSVLLTQGVGLSEGTASNIKMGTDLALGGATAAQGVGRRVASGVSGTETTIGKHTDDTLTKVGDWDLENVYDGQKQHPIRDTIYREVELVDQRGSPLGELDGIDLKNMIFYEDKRAGNFNTINPHTGKVQQTESEWAKKQIYKKTEARIQALNTANSTRTTTNGSEKIPTLQEIKNIKHFIFRLEGDTPELRKAVQQEINNLGKKFPNYTFDVIYGSK